MTKVSYREANKRFLRVFFPLIVLYVVTLFFGIYLLVTTQNPSIFLRATLAILTATPIAAVLWLMGRHLSETDEYTRKIQTDAMLIGGGVTLGIAVFWSFLELYRVVPRIDYFPSLFMVAPLFFLAWGVTCLFQRMKEHEK